MKKIITIVALAAILGLAAGAFAQRGMQWKGGSGWGMDSPYQRMYNPQTVETITGEVISLDMVTPMKGMGHGVHMMVRTDEETIPVHLGPAWYIENQDVQILPHDEVEVKGSRTMFHGAPALIAAEVKKEDQVLELRDEQGFPVWSGWRRR